MHFVRVFLYGALAAGLLSAFSTMAAEPAQEDSTATFSQAFSGGPDAANEDTGFAMVGPVEAPILDPRNFNGLWKPGVTPRKTPLVTLDDAFTLEDPPLNAKASAVVDKIRSAREAGKLPSLSTHACRSPGIYTQLFPAFVIGVVQTEDAIFQLFELPRLVRKIRLNAKHPQDLEPSYAGHSIGHWDGDTLVVETVGYNGLGELDITGAPVSDQARMVERYTKAADGKSIQLLVSVEDPVYLAEPLVVERQWILAGGLQHGEYDCEESPREDMEGQTVYFEELYRPICVRTQGQGFEPSRVKCEATSTLLQR